MIERVIENWLISANERQYQIPFCQVLSAEGQHVLYISTHGQFELGKDIISIDTDGVPCAYQLKGVPITMASWRKFHGEILQLVEYPIDNPEITTKKYHRSYLVTNQEINDAAMNAIKVANRSWVRRRFKPLTPVSRSNLLARFKAAHGSYLPREPKDLSLFLELYIRDGREPFDKQNLSRLLESVLPLASAKIEKREGQRSAASAVLLTSYVLQNCSRYENHWALIEAWTLTASYILAMATKFDLAESWWIDSYNLCMTALIRAAEDLVSECAQDELNLTVPDSLTDGYFYGPRDLLPRN